MHKIALSLMGMGLIVSGPVNARRFAGEQFRETFRTVNKRDTKKTFC